MRKKRNGNPLLQKKYEEGFVDGMEHGVRTAIDRYSQDLEALSDVKGVGEKTMERIREHFAKFYELK